MLNRRRAVLQTGLALCASLVVPSARACEFLTSTVLATLNVDYLGLLSPRPMPGISR